MRVLAALAGCLLVLGACTDDAGPDRAAYVDAVRADLLSSEDGRGLPLDEIEAGCVAEAIVDAAGVGRLDDAGLTPEDFAAAELGEIDIGTDPRQLRVDLVAPLRDCGLGPPLAAVMVPEFPFELTAGDERCIADAIDGSQQLGEGLAAVLVGLDERALGDVLTFGLASCPSIIGDLLADRITEAGFAVDDAARACITEQIETRGPDAVEQILGPEATRLGAEVTDACLG